MQGQIKIDQNLGRLDLWQ